MKMTFGVAFGMAVVAGFVTAARSASAAHNAMDRVSWNIASSVADGVAAAPPTGAAPAYAETRRSLPEMIGQVVQSLPEQERDRIADQMAARHIQLLGQQQGLQRLSPEERNQLATAMVSRSLPLLQESSGGKDSGAEGKLMEKVRDKVMKDVSGDIARHNQALCRPIIQPHLVQGIIDTIRPAEIPGRVQLSTIPMFTPKIIAQVREHFMQKRATGSVPGF